MIYTHLFIIDQGGDLEKTLKSTTDCYIVDVLSKNVNCSVDLVVTKYDRYLTIIQKEISFEKEINKLVEKTDSDYVIIINSGKELDKIVEKLERYTEKNKLSMLKDHSTLIVSTNCWRWLLGNGEQTISEKIEIAAKNENLEHLILHSLEDLCADQLEPSATP